MNAVGNSMKRHDMIASDLRHMPASKAGYDKGTVVTMTLNEDAIVLGIVNMIEMVM